MTIKEIKEFIAKVPDTMNDFNIVLGVVALSEGELIYNTYPITSLNVDEKTKMVSMMHQTEDEIKNIIRNGIAKKS